MGRCSPRPRTPWPIAARWPSHEVSRRPAALSHRLGLWVRDGSDTLADCRARWLLLLTKSQLPRISGETIASVTHPAKVNSLELSPSFAACDMPQPARHSSPSDVVCFPKRHWTRGDVVFFHLGCAGASEDCAGSHASTFERAENSRELSAERTERLTFTEARFAHAVGDAAFPATVGLLGDKPVQELLMRQAVAHRLGQHRVELLGARRHFQRGEVGQDAFTRIEGLTGPPPFLGTGGVVNRPSIDLRVQAAGRRSGLVGRSAKCP